MLLAIELYGVFDNGTALFKPRRKFIFNGLNIRGGSSITLLGSKSTLSAGSGWPRLCIPHLFFLHVVQSITAISQFAGRTYCTLAIVKGNTQTGSFSCNFRFRHTVYPCSYVLSLRAPVPPRPPGKFFPADNPENDPYSTGNV
nr:Uncharacterised protein [Klebsiella pneumoniae]